jgi:hypothetical protein
LTGLDAGTIERLARAIHDAYRAQFAGRPEVDAPWDALPDDIREANRAQARDIPVKLAAIGCVVAEGPDSAGFHFTGDEVETLSRHEHERWMAQRTAAGWRLGDRDDAEHHHPDLVPWDQLPDVARDKDRDAVVNMPRLLAVAGLHIRRGASG